MFKDQIELFKSSLTENIKTKQRVLFFGGFSVITAFIVAVIAFRAYGGSNGGGSYGGSKTSDVQKDGNLHQEKRIKIDSGGSSVDPQEIWVNRIEKQQAVLNKRFDAIEKLIGGLANDKIANGISNQEGQGVQDASHFDISHLASSHLPEQNTLNPSGLMPSARQTFQAQKMGMDEGKEHPKAVLPIKTQRVTFALDPLSSKKIKKSIDHYVPAGSFVSGRLTSGVVASTAVQSSSNPQPVHIQLTDLGNLPRGFRSDVKQCFLIGSAYGDLSSERVLMRLETLSCVERKTQEIIEIEVDGFVTGEDGSNGLRGILVDRSGPAMRNAFMGGFLSGIGSFFGQEKTMMPTTISQGGVAAVNPLTAQHLLEGGAGKGVGNAMEKLSDFYIKRAEQLQPVLEIEPGRLIHVVFKKGFDMNQTLYRQSLMNTRDVDRREIAHKVGADSISAF